MSDKPEVVYFELNNWFSGRDYPDAEPFNTWCGDDLHLQFDDKEFVKEHRLCILRQIVDQSVNWCITAPKEFVLQNCPKLLSDESTNCELIQRNPDGTRDEIVEDHLYKEFLRFPNEDGFVYGRFGTQFLEWSEENIGITEGEWL